MNKEEYDDLVEKCLTCQYCYKRKDDDNTIYCRKRNGKCEYKPYKSKRKVVQNEQTAEEKETKERRAVY